MSGLEKRGAALLAQYVYRAPDAANATGAGDAWNVLLPLLVIVAAASLMIWWGEREKSARRKRLLAPSERAPKAPDPTPPEPPAATPPPSGAPAAVAELRLLCPHCYHSGSAHAELADKSIKCVRCRGTFLGPASPDSAIERADRRLIPSAN
jgi:hypothetical protein